MFKLCFQKHKFPLWKKKKRTVFRYLAAVYLPFDYGKHLCFCGCLGESGKPVGWGQLSKQISCTTFSKQKQKKIPLLAGPEWILPLK